MEMEGGREEGRGEEMREEGRGEEMREEKKRVRRGVEKRGGKERSLAMPDKI